MAKDSPIYAAVDLGSNSFHLLIAKVQQNKIIYIDREKEQLRLAEGLLPDGTVTIDMQQRALDVLSRFSNLLEGIEPTNIRAVGTNTFRVAKQSSDFFERASQALGHPIEVISGREEARLIYLGLAKDFTPDTNKRLVIDIGGGSTELIIGDREPIKMESRYMGCVGFSHRFFPHGNITQKAYDEAVLAARQEIQDISQEFSSRHWHHVVGASGTIRTIEKIINSDRLAYGIIQRDDLHQLAKQVVNCGNTNQLNLPKLSLARRPVLPGGLAILEGIFIELGIDELHVSNYTLKEGIIYELVGRKDHIDKREETFNHLILQYNIDRFQAKRVEMLCYRLIDNFDSPLSFSGSPLKNLIHWAAGLHELGLSIAHSGYQKHGAYIIDNADLPGFNRLEQRWISFLVLNHRRKLKTLETSYGFKPDWNLLLLFRIACLLQRRRTEVSLPNLSIEAKENYFQINLPKKWCKKNPIVMQDLKAEVDYWAVLNYVFVISVNDKNLHKDETMNSDITDSELKKIKKLKKKSIKKLHKKSISTVEELAGVKKKKLAEMLDIKKKKAGKIIESAQNQIAAEHTSADTSVADKQEEEANHESQNTKQPIADKTNESTSSKPDLDTNSKQPSSGKSAKAEITNDNPDTTANVTPLNVTQEVDQKGTKKKKKG